MVGSGVVALAPFRQRVVREGIHSLKYHGTHELAEELIALAWPGRDGALRLLGCEHGVLVRVPTSRQNRKKRGYNQAELIAEAFGRRLGWEVDTSLLRKVSAGSQVGKGRAERLATGYVSVPGRPVPSNAILVDDLVTTGSTLLACRKALGAEYPALTLAAEG